MNGIIKVGHGGIEYNKNIVFFGNQHPQNVSRQRWNNIELVKGSVN